MGVHKGQKNVSDLSEPELQMVMRCLLGLLGTKLRKNKPSAPNRRAASPARYFALLFISYRQGDFYQGKH